jgi:predicted RNA-binding protein with PUA-like domain
MMRDQMRVGDRVLFYHSSADPPAVAGTAKIVREAYPDHTAWDPKDDHFDPKASPENPTWQMVDIQLDEIFAQPVPIGTLRGVKQLCGMELLGTGSRLSVQPVRPHEFELVLQLAHELSASGARKPTPAAKKAPAANKTQSPAAKSSASKANKAKPKATTRKKSAARR